VSKMILVTGYSAIAAGAEHDAEEHGADYACG